MIIYTSHYGSTARMAECLSKMTGIPALSVDSISEDGQSRLLLPGNTLVIAASLYAGNLYRKKALAALAAKTGAEKIVLLTCGLADPTDLQIRTALTAMAASLFQNRPVTLFSVTGSIDYRNLSFKDRMMMSRMKWMMKKAVKKNEKPAGIDARQFLSTYGKTWNREDYSQLKECADLLNCLKGSLPTGSSSL